MMKKIKAVWNDLNRSIYVGERREQNLKALTAVSIFTALLGFVLIIMDLTSDMKSMIIPAIATFPIGALDDSITVPAGKGDNPVFFTPSSVIFLTLSFMI